jgi:hypothetical protein
MTNSYNTPTIFANGQLSVPRLTTVIPQTWNKTPNNILQTPLPHCITMNQLKSYEYRQTPKTLDHTPHPVNLASTPKQHTPHHLTHEVNSDTTASPPQVRIIKRPNLTTKMVGNKLGEKNANVF